MNSGFRDDSVDLEENERGLMESLDGGKDWKPSPKEALFASHSTTEFTADDSLNTSSQRQRKNTLVFQLDLSETEAHASSNKTLLRGSSKTAKHSNASARNNQAETSRNKFHAIRISCGKLVNHSRFQVFIIILIAINAIMMGVGTYDFIRDNPTAYDAFETIDLIFLIIFTVELGMQFFYRGWKLVLDGWLIFDLIVVVFSWAFAQMQVIRAFRIFRALRLITRVETMKNLVVALFNVVPRMGAIALLLGLLSYIFGVMCTQLFKDLFERGVTTWDYFGRLDSSFFTLFQIMTFDNWSDIIREIIPVYPWAWIPVVTFVVISGFVVVNLIIAVVCDAVAALHDDQKAKIHGNYDSECFEDDQDISERTIDLPAERQLDALEARMKELNEMHDETLEVMHDLLHKLQESRNDSS